MKRDEFCSSSTGEREATTANRRSAKNAKKFQILLLVLFFACKYAKYRKCVARRRWYISSDLYEKKKRVFAHIQRMHNSVCCISLSLSDQVSVESFCVDCVSGRVRHNRYIGDFDERQEIVRDINSASHSSARQNWGARNAQETQHYLWRKNDLKWNPRVSTMHIFLGTVTATTSVVSAVSAWATNTRDSERERVSSTQTKRWGFIFVLGCHRGRQKKVTIGRLN